jgi:cell division septum initiation protein DivIVA
MEVSPVSAFEPHMPSEPKVDMPDFMIVLRGFDRRQVEMWAAEVANQIEQERQRADQAEKRAYRAQIESKGAASFSHLGTHVASILEEAGRSSENMLADAAERAQETVNAAEEEAAQIIKAAEHRASEIEADARRILEEARNESARIEEDALQAAEEMRAQAEQDARAVLEEARDATDMIWQEAERERLGVEAETVRLETLRHRSLEQLGRVYGHLESVLDEVRAGIDRVEEEQEDPDEATAAAAARLGVEPPASSPEESPRFPDLRPHKPTASDADSDGMLSATRPGSPDLSEAEATAQGEAPDQTAATGRGDAADRPEQPAVSEAVIGAERPAVPDGSSDGVDGLRNGDADATQPTLTAATGEITQPAPVGDPAATTEPNPPAEGAAASVNGEAGSGDEDATQRLEPVGNTGTKPRSSKPAGKGGKGRP